MNVLDTPHHTTGELLTREGGPVRIAPSLRDKLAIFADGTCLVSRASSDDVDVISAIALARRLGYKMQPPNYVDLGSLRSLYSTQETRGGWTGSNRANVRDDTTMQREVQEILQEAARQQASDVHIIIDDNGVQVRLRVNGQLTPFRSGASTINWRPEHGRQICMTTYAMAAEGGTADSNYDPFNFQAGRIMNGLPQGVQAVRLQFNPVGYSGRHLVMRLLYASHAAGHSLRDLGFSPDQVETLDDVGTEPTGIIVISGPTGSGKTTTLERMLRKIVKDNPGDSVLSVEDPPEYRIPGVIQLPVSNLRSDEDRGQAYTEAIAAALRSDPDRIMIGEVRTRAAAHHAFEAAMTGHQVLTTVHANDALSIIPRLRDIGVEEYKLRDPSLVRCLVAQRLIRSLCPHCRVPVSLTSDAIPADLAQRLAVLPHCRTVHIVGKGCPSCIEGYKGRTVVAEIIRPDQRLLDLLCVGDRVASERYWLESMGGQNFIHATLAKIAEGTVDPIQAERRIGKLVLP